MKPATDAQHAITLRYQKVVSKDRAAHTVAAFDRALELLERSHKSKTPAAKKAKPKTSKK